MSIYFVNLLTFNLMAVSGLEIHFSYLFSMSLAKAGQSCCPLSCYLSTNLQKPLSHMIDGLWSWIQKIVNAVGALFKEIAVGVYKGELKGKRAKKIRKGREEVQERIKQQSQPEWGWLGLMSIWVSYEDMEHHGSNTDDCWSALTFPSPWPTSDFVKSPSI